MPDKRARKIFLSHAGVDTPQATVLCNRLQALDDPETALTVWFDRKNLKPGQPWIDQLQQALATADGFIVYVGDSGVRNWVHMEVRAALDRAVTDPTFLFIPVFAGPRERQELGLPHFARQYQGVFNVERDPQAFQALAGAVLGDAPEALASEREPFVGLAAIGESRAHLFFGRDLSDSAHTVSDLDQLHQRVADRTFVLVSGDSGSGKSSLVKAGLLPLWRGSAFQRETERFEDLIWHVIQTQPGSRAFGALADAVAACAQRLGKSEAGVMALKSAVRGDPKLGDSISPSPPSAEAVRDALLCGLSADCTRILLVVDQFEELFTLCAADESRRFIELLVGLSELGDAVVRVVVTLRRDYVGHCFSENLRNSLGRVLAADEGRANFRLGRISTAGLRAAVIQPLILAGADSADREALADQIQDEMGDRAGDLALVQMALTETWDRREECGGDLLLAYARVGRIEGAIASAADTAYALLDPAERELAEAVFVRLAHLGDGATGTRRVALASEFRPAQWALLQKLADKEHKRLVLLSGTDDASHSGVQTAQIAHEALLTQWPMYTRWLSPVRVAHEAHSRAADKRVLDQLTAKVRELYPALARQPSDQPIPASVWRDSRKLAGPADSERHVQLLRYRSDWLTGAERAYVERSAAHHRSLAVRRRVVWSTTIVLAIVSTIALWFATQFWHEARRGEMNALAGLARIEGGNGNAATAVRLALAAQSIAREIGVQRDPTVLGALQESVYANHEEAVLRAGKPLVKAALSPVGEVITIAADGSALKWPQGGRAAPLELLSDAERPAAATHTDGRNVVTINTDGAVDLWPLDGSQHASSLGHLPWFAEEGGPLMRLLTNEVVTLQKLMMGWSVIAFSPEGDRIAASSHFGGAINVWRTTGNEPPLSLGNEGASKIVFSRDGRWLAATQDDSGESIQVRIWRLDHHERVVQLNAPKAAVPTELFDNASETVQLLMFTEDNAYLLAASHVIRVWPTDGSSNEPVVVLDKHANSPILMAEPVDDFEPDSGGIITAAADGSLRAWLAVDNDYLQVEVAQRNSRMVVLNQQLEQLLTLSGEKDLNLVSLTPDPRPTPLTGHEQKINFADFHAASGRVVTAADDGTARLWRATQEGREPRLLKDVSDDGAIRQIVLSSDGRSALIVGGNQMSWHQSGGQSAPEVRETPGRIQSVQTSADGTHMLVQDEGWRLWRDKQLLRSLGGQGDDAVQLAALSAQGRAVVTVSADGTVRMERTDGSAAPRVLATGVSSVSHLGVSADGRSVLAASRDDNTIRVWRTDAARQSRQLRFDVASESGRPRAEQDIVLSPEGRHVLLRSLSGAVQLWHWEDSDAPVDITENSQLAIFETAGNRFLTVGWDNSLRIWRTDAAAPILMPGSGREVIYATFSADGNWVLVTYSEGVAGVWPSDGRSEPLLLDSNRFDIDRIASAYISANGSSVVTVSTDGVLWWQTNAESLAAAGCRLLFDHVFTEAEHERLPIAQFKDVNLCPP